MPRRLDVVMSIAALGGLTLPAGAAVAPSAWRIATEVGSIVGARPMSDRDMAFAFGGMTESEVFNLVALPHDKAGATGLGNGFVNVQPLDMGWAINMIAYARSDSGGLEAHVDAAATFDATFDVAAGRAFELRGHNLAIFTKGPDSAPDTAEFRVQIFRDGQTVFDGSAPRGAGVPTLLFGMSESEGAAYRLLITSAVNTESRPLPGFGLGEAGVEAALDVLVIPAPLSALPLAGLAAIPRRRR